MGTRLINMPLAGDLVDTAGGLTAGGLKRVSDSSYNPTPSTIEYSRGTRANLVIAPEDTSNAAWVGGTVQTFTLTINTTYILSVHLAGVTLTLATGTGTFTVLSGTTATYGNSVAFTMLTGGTVTVTTDTANPKAQLEALPSGNVIGPNLMDNESLTARVEGYTLIVGDVYKIVSRATLDFTTVGAADNTAGTYFVCHTAAALGAGDAASTVNSPEKGAFHGVAMLAGGAEKVVNGSFETAGAGAPDLFANWTESIGGADLIEDVSDAYIGSHACKITTINSGGTTVQNYFDLTQNKLYKYQFYSKSNGIRYGRYGIYDNSHASYIIPIQSTGINSATYLGLAEFVYVPTGCIQVGLFLIASEYGTSVYFDNVSFREVNTAWTRLGTNTVAIDEAVGNGALKITYVDNASGGQLILADAADLSANLTVGQWYQLALKTAVSAGGSVNVEIRDAADAVLASYTETATTLTERKLYFKATHATTNKITFSGMEAGESIWIDDVTTKATPAEAYLSPGTYSATGAIPADPRFELIDGKTRLAANGEEVNYIPYSCDLTQADWVKTNMTTAFTSTGPKSGRYATRLTATAGNATALLTVSDTGVVGNKTYSVRLKRITGTGNVDITDNNGTTWVTQTLTSEWKRFILPTRSQAIPVVGIRIVTSGDVVDAGFNNSKVGGYAGLEIPTSGCPVVVTTEAGSALGATGYSWTKASAIDAALGVKGTVVFEYTPGHAAAVGTGTGSGLISFTSTATGLSYYDYTNTNFESADGTNVAECDTTLVSGITYLVVSSWDETADGGAGYLQVRKKVAGVLTSGVKTAFDGDFVKTGTLAFLQFANEMPGWYSSIQMYDGFVTDAALESGGGASGGIYSSSLFPIFVWSRRRIKPYAY